jgi:hypothetical protein
MGLYKSQNITTGSYMLPRADDNKNVNVSRKKINRKKREKMKEERKKNIVRNKEAGSTKDICQGSTSLPRLRLGGL